MCFRFLCPGSPHTRILRIPTRGDYRTIDWFRLEEPSKINLVTIPCHYPTQQMFSHTHTKQNDENAYSRHILPAARFPAPHPCASFGVMEIQPQVTRRRCHLPPVGEGAQGGERRPRMSLCRTEEQLPDRQLDTISCPKPIACLGAEGSGISPGTQSSRGSALTHGLRGIFNSSKPTGGRNRSCFIAVPSTAAPRPKRGSDSPARPGRAPHP